MKWSVRQNSRRLELPWIREVIVASLACWLGDIPCGREEGAHS